MDHTGMTLNGIEETQNGERIVNYDLLDGGNTFLRLPSFIKDIQTGDSDSCRFTENRWQQHETEFYECRFSDIHCCYCKSSDQYLSHWQINTDEPFIQLFFCLNGNSSLFINSDQKDELTLLTHNLAFYSSSTIVSGEWGNETPQEVFVVNLQYSLFSKYFPFQKEEIVSSTRLVNRASLISAQHMPIVPEMMMVINDILHCKRVGSLRHSFIRIKIIKLLLLQIEQYEQSQQLSLRNLRESEIKRMYEVRDILHLKPADNHKLVSLAHAVGTNDATLKNHFKKVFGKTVFSYLTTYRMEMAKKMLLDQGVKIAHVANKVGYKHATHFSAAFKKYFGYPPIKIRQLLIVSIHYEELSFFFL